MSFSRNPQISVSKRTVAKILAAIFPEENGVDTIPRK